MDIEQFLIGFLREAAFQALIRGHAGQKSAAVRFLVGLHPNTVDTW